MHVSTTCLHDSFRVCIHACQNNSISRCMRCRVKDYEVRASLYIFKKLKRKRRLIMTGKQLIDAIKKYGLEDYDIWQSDLLSNFIIEFDNGTEELPYPKYKDAHFDEPAYIFRYKRLEIDPDGSATCYNTELNTSIA